MQINLAAPHDKLKMEMQRETIWVVLTWPVLSAITICSEINFYLRNNQCV